MKSGILNIILIVVSILLALIIAPFLLRLAWGVIGILFIIIIAYILFIVSKQLIK
ncbi:MAG: hypothetical protein C5S40_05840 [ANME-2 cluster archaeon]|nr:hypothetical protein [ANME-2 cluster archaeon]